MSKVIFLPYVVFFPIMCLAQSPLPPCPWFGLAHNCFGTITLHFGAKYVGEFRDGKAHGQGTVTFIDGRKHVGEWRDDKRNGQGIEYRANGFAIRSGRWENDSLVQRYALDTNCFPFNPSSQVAAAPAVDPGKAERAQLAGLDVLGHGGRAAGHGVDLATQQR